MQGKNIIILGIIILVAGIFMYFLGNEIAANAYTNMILSLGQNYADYKSIVEFGGLVKFMGIALSCSSFPIMVFGVVKHDSKMRKDEPISNTPFCPKCNTELKTTSKFCYRCGTRVK